MEHATSYPRLMLALAKYTLASDLVFPQTWNMLQDKLQDASYAAPR